MDVPETSTQSSRAAALRRKSAAVISGLTVEVGGESTLLRASDRSRADAILHLLADAKDRIESTDAFARILATFAPSHEPQLLRRFFPHAAALSRLPVWELALDPDPTRRVSAVAKLLDAVRVQLEDGPT